MSFDLSALQSLGLATASAATSRTHLGQDTFLKLMTAQLNNQNPLKPQDNTEFLTQMAQFSTVSGIQDLQDSFKSFAAAIQQDQSVAASALVGHSATVATDKALLPTNGAMSGQLVLPADATQVTLRILDANGQVVKVEQLGPQARGALPFQWDGAQDGGAPAAPGVYRLQAEAVVGGETTAVETQSTAPVTGVALGGAKGMQVELQGLGSFSLSDIQAIN
jgi:flagellar basal-body rod modification protein FlgD